MLEGQEAFNRKPGLAPARPESSSPLNSFLTLVSLFSITVSYYCSSFYTLLCTVTRAQQHNTLVINCSGSVPSTAAVPELPELGVNELIDLYGYLCTLAEAGSAQVMQTSKQKTRNI